jgi:hypothetical protein
MKLVRLSNRLGSDIHDNAPSSMSGKQPTSSFFGRIQRAYLGKLTMLACYDRALAIAMLKVIHQVEEPSSLWAPKTLLRALRLMLLRKFISTVAR